jgi:hypothetical protein
MAMVIVALVATAAYLGYRHLRHTDIVRRMLRPTRILTEADARRAERALIDDPDDLATREALTLYYIGQPRFEENREQHVLWLIRHHPECPCTDSAAEWLAPDEAHYAEAKALWLQQVESHAVDVAVLTNAASAMQFEPQLSRKLANRALATNPDNPQARRTLAESYTREMRFARSAEQRQSAAANALRAWEDYENVEPDEFLRGTNLRELTIAAFEAGDRVKAKQYATQLLDIQQKTSNPFGPDNDGIHVGNTILGRLALQDGNIAEAKQRLLASAPERGSPVLDSYGPRMTLAADLLAKGEGNVVVGYLEKCRAFWNLGHGKENISLWESEIRAGKKPDFGDNLRP